MTTLKGIIGASYTPVALNSCLAISVAGTATIARQVKAANALNLLYKAEELAKLTEAATLHRRASDDTNLSDAALAAEAADLAQRVAANQAELKKDYNWDAATIAAPAADAQAFEAQLTAPKLAIDANKIKGTTAEATLNDFLRDDLRAGMELLKDTRPEAYEALREASQVDDARRRKAKAGITQPTSSSQTITAVLLVIMTTFLASCSPNLAMRYRNNNNDVNKLHTWVNDDMVPQLADVELNSFTIREEIPPATPKAATATILSLSDKGQAAFIEAFSSRPARTPAEEEKLLKTLTGDFPADKPARTRIKIIPKTLSKSLLFTVERGRYYKPSSTGRLFNHPADRLSYLELSVLAPTNKSIQFNSWDRFVSMYGTVDLGQVTSAQQWSATLTASAKATTNLGVTASTGEEGTVVIPPATATTANATSTGGSNATTTAKTTGANGTTATTGSELGATGNLTYADKYETSQKLSTRIVSLSGTLSPQSIKVIQEGAQGIDLSGNQAISVEYTTTAGWATPIWVHQLPAKLYDAAGKPVVLAAHDLPGFYFLFPDVNLQQDSVINGTLRYRFLYRSVIAGNKHLPEARHKVEYLYGEVGYKTEKVGKEDGKNEISNSNKGTFIQTGKQVALARASDFRPKTYRIAFVQPAVGAIPASTRFLSFGAANEVIQFETMKEALTFYEYLRNLLLAPTLSHANFTIGGAVLAPADFTSLRLISYQN